MPVTLDRPAVADSWVFQEGWQPVAGQVTMHMCGAPSDGSAWVSADMWPEEEST
jgi:hypothetical protein